MEKSLIQSKNKIAIKFIKEIKSFLDAILPRNNPKLRKICAERSTYYIAPYHKLPGNIEEFLSKIFKGMVESYAIRENLINNLMNSKDFFIRDLFNEIDSNKKGFMNFSE